MNLFKSVNQFVLAGIFSSAAVMGFAQAAPTPDVMVLVDGEKFIGQLESATAAGVVFKSDLAGEVKVDWAKIKDLQSSGKFAVAKKGETFGRRSDPAKVPQGTVAVEDQKITVTPASGKPEVVAVADAQNVIPQDSFMRAFRHPRLSDYWTGSAGAGFAWVQSTQKSEVLTTAVNLSRTVANEGWINPRYRTILGFNSAFGNVTSTTNGVKSTIKTNIINAGLEQDEYINKRLFAFGDVSFLHNYSQDLDLQYSIGGGLGFVAYKDAHQELDLKGQIAYTSQHFGEISSVINGRTVITTPAKTNNLIGAVLGDTYDRAFNKGITFHQELAVIPSFNQPSAWSANFIAGLGVPVSKRFNVTFGVVDSYLNNPPPSFQKNSFQFVANLAYKIN